MSVFHNLKLKMQLLNAKKDAYLHLEKKLIESTYKEINEDKEIVDMIFNLNLNLDLKSLKLFFKYGVSVHNKDKYNNNLLYIYKNDLRIVKYLFNKGVDINNINDYGESPLFSGNKNVVKFLIGKGANINQINNDGENILFVHNKDADFIRYLIDMGVKYDCVTTNGENICFRNTGLINSLKEYEVKAMFKKSYLNKADRNIAFILFYYVLNSNDSNIAISTLKKLEQYRIQVNYNQIDKSGDNLYRYANTSEMLEILLDKNVPLTVINNNGDCMLDLIYNKDYMKNNDNLELKEKILKVLALREKEILDVIIRNESSNKIKNRL